MAQTREALGWQSTTADVCDGINLTGKVAVVTGASGGLGAESGRALAHSGAQGRSGPA